MSFVGVGSWLIDRPPSHCVCTISVVGVSLKDLISAIPAYAFMWKSAPSSSGGRVMSEATVLLERASDDSECRDRGGEEVRDETLVLHTE